MVKILFLYAKIGGWCRFSGLLIPDLFSELKDRASRRKGISNVIELPKRNLTPAIFCGIMQHVKEAAQLTSCVQVPKIRTHYSTQNCVRAG